MAPKTSTPTKVVKRTPKKTPTKPGQIRDTEMKKNLLLLWVVFKTSGAHVNLAALSEHFNIKPNAAQMRFTRLKKKLEEMEAAEAEEAGDAQATAANDADADSDEGADAKLDSGDSA
ncbi:hypothetical protein N7452_002460 [Penicillium brevicompactum]|uniref:Myb-like DNA-binding domain-containing protein n=1 Tax=Penicillium brevicompactum TaxID=5074 RepID=A0A9W9UJ73_PENBR|nr:hypothetical protein N7452_002460 [Penicillium brevicompactum]